MAKATQINVYADPELAERIKAEAKADMRSESMMMAMLAKEALDARDARRNSKAA